MDDKTLFQNKPANPWVPQDVQPQPSEPVSAPPSQPASNPWVPTAPQSQEPQNDLNAASKEQDSSVSVSTTVSTEVPAQGSFAPQSATPVSVPQENPFTPSVEQSVVYKPSSSTPPPPPASSIFSIGNLIKILIGVAALIIVFFFVFKIIPGFFGGGGGKVTLNYWGLWEDSPTMGAVISDFERANPNITVNYSKQDVKQYRETLSTRIQNGNGPDIFEIHNTWLPIFRSSLLPVSSDVITKDEFSKSFYPVASSDLISNGAIYAIPANMDVLSMYVNTGLFDSAGISAPTNWQDFITASRQLTVKDENGKIQTAGAALGTFDNITHAPDIISMLLAQNGANLSNLSKTPTQTNDALTFYTSFATGNANVWDDTLDPSIIAFEKGNLAIYFGYSWDYFSIRAANPNLSFSIVPVPSLPGQSQTVSSYWANGVWIKSAHQKEALMFLKFLSQKDTQQKLYTTESKTRTFGELYSRVDLASSLKDNPTISAFVSQAPGAVSSYFISDTYDNALNSQLNTYLGNAIRSILNSTSVDSASGTLSSGEAQVLTQYGK